MYVFSPFRVACVVSPWYYYPNLPAYLTLSRVVVVDGQTCDWNEGTTYAYRPSAVADTPNNSGLNESVDQIKAIFLNQDQQAIENLIPTESQVAFHNDGKYMYSLNGTDFQQMLADNAKDTQTSSFEITSVNVKGEEAIVKCTHVFTDAQSGNDTVYQLYRLRNTDGKFVISDFMASHTPFKRKIRF